MSIHSSTLKKATDHGFKLTEDAHGKVLLHSTKPAFQFIGDDAKALVAGAVAAKTAESEFSIHVTQQKNGIFIAKKDTETLAKGDDLEAVVAEALDGLEETPDSDEAPESAGSVVPQKYKEIYTLRGDPTTCGDWLAVTLRKLWRVGEGSKAYTDVDIVRQIAEANGINDSDKYELVKNVGWQGRKAMSVRNRLVKIVATRGVLIDPINDKELKAPKEWLSANAKYVEQTEPATTARKPSKRSTSRKAA